MASALERASGVGSSTQPTKDLNSWTSKWFNRFKDNLGSEAVPRKIPNQIPIAYSAKDRVALAQEADRQKLRRFNIEEDRMFDSVSYDTPAAVMGNAREQQGIRDFTPGPNPDDEGWATLEGDTVPVQEYSPRKAIQPSSMDELAAALTGGGNRPGIKDTVAPTLAPVDFGGQTLDPVTGQVVQAPTFSAYPSTVREPSPLNTSKKSSSKRKTPQSTAKAPSKAPARAALTADPRLSPVLPIPPREALKPTHEDRLAMLNPEYADDPDFGITY